jgi:isoleucyl-tRNA synthetase
MGYNAYQFHNVYTAVHNFCTVELSSFYLDISKDLLYTNPADATARRATQTVMYDILTMLVKLLTPIIPHTAEEVWSYIEGTEADFIQLTDIPKPDTRFMDEDELENKWDKIVQVRDDVLKALEEARREKKIGGSLDAKVHLYPSAEVSQWLGQFADMDKLLIVSQVEVHAAGQQAPQDAVTFDGLQVRVVKAEGEKCERCWVITPDRGQHPEHPTLSPRCTHTVQTYIKDVAQEG